MGSRAQSPSSAARSGELAAYDGRETPPLPPQATKAATYPKMSRSVLFRKEGAVLEERLTGESSHLVALQDQDDCPARTLAAGAADDSAEAASSERANCLPRNSFLLLEGTEKSHSVPLSSDAALGKRKSEQAKQLAKTPGKEQQVSKRISPGSSSRRSSGAPSPAVVQHGPEKGEVAKSTPGSGSRRGIRGRGVVQTNPETQERIHHRTQKDAAKSVEAPQSSICLAIQQKRLCKGYLWHFSDEGAANADSVSDGLGILSGVVDSGKGADGKGPMEGKASNEEEAVERRAKKRARVLDLARMEEGGVGEGASCGKKKEKKQTERVDGRAMNTSGNHGLSASNLHGETGLTPEGGSGPVTASPLRDRASPMAPLKISEAGAELSAFPDAFASQKLLQESMELSDIEGDDRESREGSVVFGADFDSCNSGKHSRKFSLASGSVDGDGADHSDGSVSSKEVMFRATTEPCFRSSALSVHSLIRVTKWTLFLLFKIFLCFR